MRGHWGLHTCPSLPNDPLTSVGWARQGVGGLGVLPVWACPQALRRAPRGRLSVQAGPPMQPESQRADGCCRGQAQGSQDRLSAAAGPHRVPRQPPQCGLWSPAHPSGPPWDPRAMEMASQAAENLGSRHGAQREGLRPSLGVPSSASKGPPTRVCTAAGRCVRPGVHQGLSG